MKSYIEMFNSDKYEPFMFYGKYSTENINGKTLLNINGKGIVCFYYNVIENQSYTAYATLEVNQDSKKKTYQISSYDRDYTLSCAVDGDCNIIKIYDEQYIIFHNYEEEYIYHTTTLENFFKFHGGSNPTNYTKAFLQPLYFNDLFSFKVSSYTNTQAGSKLTIAIIGFKLKE